MAGISRRKLLAAAISCAACGFSSRVVRAAMGPNDKFDLVIRGAQVLDPSGKSGKFDVGIRFGKIEALEAKIAEERALRVIDATGKLVTPGLIDLHAHVFPYGSALGIPADELVQFQATTTMVSAGDAGANNFAAFRRHIVAQTRTRLYAFVHIANIGLAGFPVPELFNISYADPAAAAKTIAENADMVIGVKVRMSENVIAQHGLEPLKRAIQACVMAGTGAKVMCHIGGVQTRALMSQILDTLRKDDILTHAYSGAPNNAGEGTNICRTASSSPQRSKQKGAASSSMSGTAAAASTTRSPSPRSHKARRPTRSPPTFTSSRATRRACLISLG